MSSSDQGCHVEAGAHRTATSQDGAFALEPATIAIKRSQRRSLTPVEFSKLGHLRQQQGGGARTDSSDGRELLRFAGEPVRLLDQLLKQEIQRIDLLLDRADELLVEG